MSVDELTALQAAVRDYLRLEHQVEAGTHMDLQALNSSAAAREQRLHEARKRMQRLAGGDETD